MTWKLTEWAKTRSGVFGVPWRDLSDDEFAAVEARYPEIRERGYFEKVPAAPAAPVMPQRQGRGKR